PRRRARPHHAARHGEGAPGAGRPVPPAGARPASRGAEAGAAQAGGGSARRFLTNERATQGERRELPSDALGDPGAGPNVVDLGRAVLQRRLESTHLLIADARQVEVEAVSHKSYRTPVAIHLHARAGDVVIDDAKHLNAYRP